MLLAEGLKPDPEKMKAVAQIPPPENKQTLMRFAGMVQYLSKFIPNLSLLSASLRKLMERDVEWHWEDSQVESFEKLKTPTLKFYDVQKPVTLSCDIRALSFEGIRAVILQGGSRVHTDVQR